MKISFGQIRALTGQSVEEGFGNYFDVFAQALSSPPHIWIHKPGQTQVVLR